MSNQNNETIASFNSITLIPVKIGNLGQIIRRISEMDDSGPNSTDADNILEYLQDPEAAIVTLVIDGGIGSISLSEEFVNCLSQNGFKEVFSSGEST